MATVLFFGKFRDLFGQQTTEISLPPNVSCVSDLINLIADKDAAIAESLRENGILYVVNENIVPVEMMINDGDEIAFLPPVSGG